MQLARLPRFHRAAQAAAIALTQRDRETLRRVFQHRFLRSSHVLALLPGSRQQILRRMQLLFHHSYLDRPRAQIDYYCRGSRAMVYGLGNKGMQLLEREDGIGSRKLDWTARNRSVTRFFMEHTLAVADAMVALELSCRKRGVEFIRHGNETGSPFKWSVPVRHGGMLVSVGVVPDRVFGLKTQKEVRWFFLEADRATMPVERNNLKQTSFYRKLLAYHETWRQRALKDSFPRFQVLAITTTPERVENMVQGARRVTRDKGSGLFLFTDERSFTTAPDVLSLPLLNGRGEQTFMLD